MSKKTKTVVLEGNICCGKSTLCSVTAKKYGAQYADTRMESVNHDLLSAFYENPKKYAFAMQWGQLKQRIALAEIAKMRKSLITNPSPEYMLIDRGLIGDHCFAIWNMLSGNITSVKEYRAYYSELALPLGYADFVTSDIITAHADFVIFIDAEPSLCKSRSVGERKDDAEKNIAFDYFRGIDSVHFCVMRDLVINRKAAAHIYSTPGTNDPSSFKEFLYDISSGKRKPAYIDYQNPPPMSARKSGKVVVYDCNSIIDAYRSRDKLANERSDVYIDTAGMADNTAMKTLVNTDWFPQVAMYHNEYIRMVYHHLRLGDHVHLFSSSLSSSPTQTH